MGFIGYSKNVQFFFLKNYYIVLISYTFVKLLQSVINFCLACQITIYFWILSSQNQN
jgi:hypothetical protein